MKKWMFALSAVCLLTFALSIAVAGGPPTTSPPRQDSGSTVVNCGEYTITVSPTSLWPPNHAMVPISVNVRDHEDPSGEKMCVTVNSVSGNQGGATSAPAGLHCGTPSNSFTQTV